MLNFPPVVSTGGFHFAVSVISSVGEELSDAFATVTLPLSSFTTLYFSLPLYHPSNVYPVLDTASVCAINKRVLFPESLAAELPFIAIILFAVVESLHVPPSGLNVSVYFGFFGSTVEMCSFGSFLPAGSESSHTFVTVIIPVSALSFTKTNVCVSSVPPFAFSSTWLVSDAFTMLTFP